MPSIIDGLQKILSRLQERSLFRKFIEVNDPGPEKGDNILWISLVFGTTLGKGFQQPKNL
jgi:hypothetical protein